MDQSSIVLRDTFHLSRLTRNDLRMLADFFSILLLLSHFGLNFSEHVLDIRRCDRSRDGMFHGTPEPPDLVG
jgi:hypothetical protein